MKKWADRWAVVTGASSGIGTEIARQLAARGMHLVLTARREDRLQALAEEVQTAHGSKTLLIPGDLLDPAEPKRIFDRVTEEGLDVALLVNNAGFGSFASVEDTDTETAVNVTRLNVTALTELTYRFLEPMLARDEGTILNVASVAAFQPVAYMPAYSASKAYVLHFTESLWAELRDTNVSITALCPGTTRTEFFDQAGDSTWLSRQSSHTAAAVAKKGLNAAAKGKLSVVPGLKNAIAVQLSRFFPRKLVVMETRKYFRPKRKREKDAGD